MSKKTVCPVRKDFTEGKGISVLAIVTCLVIDGVLLVVLLVMAFWLRDKIESKEFLYIFTIFILVAIISGFIVSYFFYKQTLLYNLEIYKMCNENNKPPTEPPSEMYKIKETNISKVKKQKVIKI